MRNFEEILGEVIIKQLYIQENQMQSKLRSEYFMFRYDEPHTIWLRQFLDNQRFLRLGDNSERV